MAVNAALDSSELVSQLRSRHALSQRTSNPVPVFTHGNVNESTATLPNGPSGIPRPGVGSSRPVSADDKSLAHKKNYKNYGLDLSKGRVADMIKLGVVEPGMSKVKQLKSAVEACVAIMRIDTLIKLDPAPPSGDDGHGH